MSGICGVWSIGGGHPDLNAVLSRLRRRGPDRNGSWVNGQIALGHTLLATTPEAVVEILPLTDLESGCTITADVRLDNREELIDAFGLHRETRVVGDGELILSAYLKWGQDCPTHLLGDFAFAIWDPRVERLFCARDHMGMRQLIYFHDPRRLFVFASDAEAVLAQAAVPKHVSLGRIADYLDDLEGLDRTSTFFEGVSRLPAAHTLTVDAGAGLSIRPYWQLKPSSELNLPNEQAYADALLDVLTEAVRCRLRSPTPVGSMLSGGMDSGSVVAIAATLLAAGGDGPLLTFSAVGPNAEACVETRSIRTTASVAGLAPHFITTEDLVADRTGLTSQPGTEPFDSHMTLVHSVYLAAKRAGVRVMLDGVGGDVVLTAGNRVAQLFRKGQFRAAIREARGEENFWGKFWPQWKTLLKSAWAAFIPSPLRDLRRWFKVAMSDHFRTNILIGREFAQHVDLASRRRHHRRHIPASNLPVPEQRALAICHPHMVVGRERYDRVASTFGIEARDPFMDLRVVEFCLSLPPDQLQKDGWPKMILRRAMRGLLPPEVIWRRGKEHLGADFTRALFANSEGWQNELWQHCKRADFSPLIFQNFRKLERCDTPEYINNKLFFLLKWIRRVRKNLAVGMDSGI